MTEYSVIGQRVPLIDANERVTGSAKFVGDIRLPGMLFAKVLMSPYPHANIKSIDTSRAEKLLGVVTVVTYKDAEALPLSWAIWDRHIMEGTVRFAGDVVAAVAAESIEIAEEALELIEVDYETLPFVLDAKEAMQKDAPQVHPEVTDNNVVTNVPFVSHNGDIEKGFAEADFIIEEDFETPSVSASAAEPRVTLASWDVEGKLTIWSAEQCPFETRDWILAGIFSLPATKIRVVAPYLGGGFGNKGGAYIDQIAALVAKKAGRPVLLAYVEREEIIGGQLRHSNYAHYKVGAKNDGTITAMQATHILNTGAYECNGITVATVGMQSSVIARAFRCQNVECSAYLVYTNQAVAGAYRGYGLPQGCFPTESILARVAEKLNMNPVEFKKKNLWPSLEDAWANNVGLPQSYAMADCIREGAKAIDWDNKWKGWNIPVSVDGTKRRGIGMAITHHPNGAYFAQGSAIVRFNKGDGTITLHVGSPDCGAGQKTTLTQVCAEAMGAKWGDVCVVNADTDTCPWTYGLWSTRTAQAQAIAIKEACEKVKAQLYPVAAAIIGVDASDIATKDSAFYSKSDSSKTVAFYGLYASSVNMIGGETNNTVGEVYGSANTLSDLETTVTEGSAVFAAQFAEVEVDTETGKVDVKKFVAAHDVGKAINPIVVENQIEGGVMQGLGYSLSEKIVFDKATGVMLNPNWETYKTPAMLDAPDELQPVLIEADTNYTCPVDPRAAFGIKGVGEPPLVPVAPAIAMAIRNAIGVNFNKVPILPEDILKALGKV